MAKTSIEMRTPPPPITACHDCGRVQQLPDLPVGSKAMCGRCRAVLFRKTPDTVQRTLALAVTGLILFAIANVYPFLSMRLEGQIRETTLITGIAGLYHQGMPGLSGLVLLTSVLVPLVQLMGLVYLLSPMVIGRLAGRSAGVFRALQRLRPWSMMEVFMLGILVSMIKLAKMADIIPGVALWAFAGLIVVLLAAFSGLNPDDIWRRIPLSPRARDEGVHGPVRAATCHSCTLMVQVPTRSPWGNARCPRCNARLHARKPNSIQRTWALVLTAIVFYAPANLMPITFTRTVAREQADTIMSGVIYFMFSGSWHIALVIFVASVLIPILKLVSLIYLLLSVQFRSQWKPEDRTRLYRFTEAVGRWSMVDVYVVTVLVALVQLGPLGAIEAGPGAIYFAAVVVMTMLAAESFDARLIWDKKD
ncbi:MAG: paraquat-inducible protein A [Desulfobacterium sp.]|nr:paraquat-inducible protein A [Desulfobacterium sp.]